MCLQSGAGYVCTPYSHLPPQSSEGAARHQNLPEPVFFNLSLGKCCEISAVLFSNKEAARRKFKVETQ